MLQIQFSGTSCEPLRKIWRSSGLPVSIFKRAAITCLLFAFCLTAHADFDAKYKAYSGDLDGNGYTDLFLSRSPDLVMIPLDDLLVPVPTRRAEHLVLMQNGSGTFTINSSPSASDLVTLRSWSQSQVQLTASDVNVDGQQDLFIENFASDPKFWGQGTFSHIVYAPKGSQTATAVAVNQAMRDFFAQVYGWKIDRDYFIRKAIENDWYHYTGNEVTGWFYIDYIDTYYAYDGSLRYLDESDDPSDPNNRPAYCDDYPTYCMFAVDAGSWVVFGTYLANIQVIIEYEHFNQDALSFVQAVGTAFDDPNSQVDPSQAEAILEAKLMAQTGETVADVLKYPVPRPDVPPEMTPEPPLRTPRGPLPPAANDPNYFPKPKLKWGGIIGRIIITACDLFCGQGDEHERKKLEWFQFGWEWALDDMARRGQEPPDVVIGEGEGGGIYVRVPQAAQAWGALYLSYGRDPSTGQEAPFTSETPDPWPSEYDDYMWAMNHGWLRALMANVAVFYDIQLHGPRRGRGIFYPCERKVLEGYPLRFEETWPVTAPFDNTPCRFM